MAEHALVLHARIGRSKPSPFGVPIEDEAKAPVADPRVAWRRALDAVRRLPAVFALLLVLLGAGWPHWEWMARRLTDGSDEPWGFLALATVLALVGRERQRLVLPMPAALATSAAFMLAAALARAWAPPIFAAALAMLALAVFLACALRERPAMPLATLLLLALPLIASLQFYFGYPLRLATAHTAAPLLRLAGFEVEAAGAAFEWNGSLVLVDPPCAGIGMLWVGTYTAALLSWLNRATTARTLATAMVAAASVFGANVARNAALFFPEAMALDWPAWSHSAIGLAAFALALAPVVWVANRLAGSHA
jgi:exosortase/archaeosortase family protein